MTIFISTHVRVLTGMLADRRVVKSLTRFGLIVLAVGLVVRALPLLIVPS